MTKNFFIAFEGIDGSGKSTQVALLAKKLQEAGHQVYVTSEPTDSPMGKLIRDAFNHRLILDDRAIAALFVADRLDHILNQTSGILKLLADGYTVITDRYYLSSYAYQSSFIDLNWILQANSLCADLLKPDLNIYIDIPADLSMERLTAGRKSVEIYETLANLQNVRSKYLEVIALLKNKEEVLIVDGNRSPEAIATNIWEKTSDKFDLREV